MTGIIDALYKRVLLAAHPVGSIYQSTDATSPATLFGGTWTAIESRFLLAASSAYPAGSTGGEATHALTASELPKISGTIGAGSGNFGTTSGGYGAFRSCSGVFSSRGEMQYARAQSAYAEGWPSSDAGIYYVDMAFGGGEAHTNMPPYMAVYMWRRTA